MTTTPIHPFQKAGLGIAPFRVLAYECRRGPIKRVENGVLVTYGSPGQPVTACEYCSTPIVHVYIIESSDGREFVVGCECVRKTGDAHLLKQSKQHLGEFRAKQREAQRVERKQVWENQRRVEVDAQKREWLAANPWWSPFAAKHGQNQFVQSLANTLHLWGTLSEKQVQFAQRLLVQLDVPKVPVPITEGRTRVTGTIVSMRTDRNGYGRVETKVLLDVTTDAGAYRLWGTLPDGAYRAVRGDTLAFDAIVQRSDRDVAFGFYKRPTKVVLTPAEAGVEA